MNSVTKVACYIIGIRVFEKAVWADNPTFRATCLNSHCSEVAFEYGFKHVASNKV